MPYLKYDEQLQLICYSWLKRLQLGQGGAAGGGRALWQDSVFVTDKISVVFIRPQTIGRLLQFVFAR